MNTFPDLRLRRMRRTAGIRAMFDLEIPGPAKWCWPTFVVPGTGLREEIASMPGQFRWSVDRIVEAVEPVVRQGVGSVLLFGQTDRPKDNGGSAGKIQEVSLKDGKFATLWRDVRPIPENRDFFENVWRQYRENKNIY